jgi:phosphopantothenate synthetase
MANNSEIAEKGAQIRVNIFIRVGKRHEKLANFLKAHNSLKKGTKLRIMPIGYSGCVFYAANAVCFE